MRLRYRLYRALEGVVALAMLAFVAVLVLNLILTHLGPQGAPGLEREVSLWEAFLDLWRTPLELWREIGLATVLTGILMWWLTGGSKKDGDT